MISEVQKWAGKTISYTTEIIFICYKEMKALQKPVKHLKLNLDGKRYLYIIETIYTQRKAQLFQMYQNRSLLLQLQEKQVL